VAFVAVTDARVCQDLDIPAMALDLILVEDAGRLDTFQGHRLALPRVGDDDAYDARWQRNHNSMKSWPRDQTHASDSTVVLTIGSVNSAGSRTGHGQNGTQDSALQWAHRRGGKTHLIATSQRADRCSIQDGHAAAS